MTKTVDRLAHTAVHAARHPLSTLAYAAGFAKGAAALVIHAVGERAGQKDQRAVVPFPEQRTAQTGQSFEQVPLAEPREPAEPAEPAAPGESFAHEPRPVSPHGEPTRRTEADIDGWEADVYLDEHPEIDPAADSVVEALALNDLPGEDQVDRGAIRAVLSEAENLRGETR